MISMTPLTFILIVCSVLFLFFAVDGWQRGKFNFLHFLIFIGGIGVILLSLIYPWFQERFSSFFGVARVADIIVYSWLIALAYFYFDLLNTNTKQKFNTSRFVSADAIRMGVLPIVKPASAPKDKFLFLVRAYNEASQIGATIDAIFGAWFSKIVVVNDGSIDDTEWVVLQKKAQYTEKTLVVLSHLINRGWGAANKTGFAWIVRYLPKLDIDRVVTYDADGQMDINDMQTFMQRIQANMQAGKKVLAYLGSRFLDGSKTENMPRSRRVILRGSTIITKIFNKLSVSDPHNGYRVLHTDFVQTLKLYSDGMAYASELLENIQRQNIPHEEVPVHIKYTEYSLQKWQKNGNAIKILGELIYKKLFFR